MSRWIKSFESHKFNEHWEELQNIIENLHFNDETDASEVQELARFKKIAKYIDALLKSIDIELIPEEVWGNSEPNAKDCLGKINKYEETKDLSYLANANDCLDKILSSIIPYQAYTSEVGSASAAAFRKYARTVESSLESFTGKTNESLTKLNKIIKEAESNASDTNTSYEKIKELETYCFNDDENNESLRTKLRNIKEELEEYHSQIHRYHSEIFEGDRNKESIKNEIEKALRDSKEQADTISELLGETKEETSDYKKYHAMVFGTKNKEGDYEGGLRGEIENRKQNLEEFKNKQEEIHNTLKKEIEGLLPGATSAGLASAYHELKESFNKPIKQFTCIFYISLAILISIAVFPFIDSANSDSINTGNISAFISNIIYKLPLILPALWLAIFATKRRNEANRLQQEYAHKEALAKSYQNFKNQIKELEKPDELMEKLLSATIDAVSYNASITLDKKYEESTPVNDTLKEITSQVINNKTK